MQKLASKKLEKMMIFWYAAKRGLDIWNKKLKIISGIEI
jgi:hypothetical protein